MSNGHDQGAGAIALPPTIARFLGRTRRRMRVERALTGAGYGLAVGAAAGIVVGVVARLWPVLLPGQLLPILLGLAGGGIALGATFAAARSLPLRLVAARCDRDLGLRERLGTALELADGTARSTLAPQQLAETATLVAGRGTGARALPRPGSLWSRQGALAVAALVAMLAFLLLAPNRQTAIIQRQRLNQALVQEAARQVAQIEDQVQGRNDLDPATKQALERQLEQLRKDLADGTIDRNTAIARIAETEAQLRRLQDPTPERAAQGLPELADEFTTFGATADIGQRLAAGDYAGAGQALKDFGSRLADLDPASRQALAQKLREAAASQAATDPRLAQQLQDAADAIERGDIAAAQAALDLAGNDIAQTGQELATQGQLSGTLGDLGAIKRDVANGQSPTTAGATPQRPRGSPIALSGTPVVLNGQGTPARVGGTPVAVATGGTPVLVQGPGQGQGQGGQGQGQGQGQGSGAGQGQGQGQGGAGSGSGGSGYGSGTSTGASQQPPGAGSPAQNPQGGQGRPNDAGSYDPVYAPTLPGGPAGQQQQLPGSGGAGAPPSGTTPGVGVNTPSSVPYNEVYEQYRDAALKGLDDPSIPPELRDYIRQYFSDIDPNAKR